MYFSALDTLNSIVAGPKCSNASDQNIDVWGSSKHYKNRNFGAGKIMPSTFPLPLPNYFSFKGW